MAGGAGRVTGLPGLAIMRRMEGLPRPREPTMPVPGPARAPRVAPLRRAQILAGACALALLAAPACGEPQAAPGSASGAYLRTLAALSAGDAAALLPLLEDGAQRDLEASCVALNRAAELVTQHYPADRQAAVLGGLGAGRCARGAAGLLAALWAPAGSRTLKTLQAWGARPSGETPDAAGTRVSVATLAGDVFTFARRADGTWGWVLADADRAAIRAALAAATTNLRVVEAEAARLDALRSPQGLPTP